MEGEVPAMGDVDRTTGGTTELRVHGVSGTPPEATLDHPHTERVAGDADAGFYRRGGGGGGRGGGGGAGGGTGGRRGLPGRTAGAAPTSIGSRRTPGAASPPAAGAGRSICCSCR